MDETSLSDANIALMDAMKVLIDLALVTNQTNPRYFDQCFSHQRDGYIEKKMPAAAAVMELLRAFSTDREREAFRETLAKFRGAPTQGSA